MKKAIWLVVAVMIIGLLTVGTAFAEVVFEDDFSDTEFSKSVWTYVLAWDTGWSLTESDWASHDLKIEDGLLTITNNADSHNQIVLLHDVGVTDGTLEFKFRAVEEIGFHMGAWFRGFQMEGGGYNGHLIYSTAEALSWQCPEVGTPVIRGFIAHGPFQADEWYVVKLVMEGAKVDVYINGESIASVKTPEAQGSLIGVYGSGNGVIQYDYIRLTK